MDFQEIVKDLLATGLTQTELAKMAGTTQPTINRIKEGVTKMPVFPVADKLRKLHKKRKKSD